MFVRNGEALGSVRHRDDPGAKESPKKKSPKKADPSPEPAPQEPPVVPEKQPEPPPQPTEETPSLDDLLPKSGKASG